jgi:hypothetical protein
MERIEKKISIKYNKAIIIVMFGNENMIYNIYTNKHI